MKIKNISGYGDLDVPDLGRVNAGQVVDVADEELAGRMLEQVNTWAAAEQPDDVPAVREGEN